MAILNGKIVPIQSDIIKVGMRLTSKTISNVIYNLAESTSMTGQSEQYFPICSDGCSYDEDIVDGVLATTITFINNTVLPGNPELGLDTNHLKDGPENFGIKLGKKSGVRTIVHTERIG